MKDRITHAGDIKPDFKEVKKTWDKMLNHHIPDASSDYSYKTILFWVVK